MLAQGIYVFIHWATNILFYIILIIIIIILQIDFYSLLIISRKIVL